MGRAKLVPVGTLRAIADILQGTRLLPVRASTQRVGASTRVALWYTDGAGAQHGVTVTFGPARAKVVSAAGCMAGVPKGTTHANGLQLLRNVLVHLGAATQHCATWWQCAGCRPCVLRGLPCGCGVACGL